MPFDEGGTLAHHDLHVELLELAAVEHAPVGKMTGRRAVGAPLAEVVLAADVQRDVRRQAGAMLLQEADHPAEVVVVAVAQDPRLGFRHVDADELDVFEESLRGVSRSRASAAWCRSRCATGWRWRGPTRCAASSRSAPR